MHQWNPSDYEKNSSAQERAALAVLSKLDLKGDEHILDIGCGDGKITLKMAAMVPRGKVLGIDSSDEMIAFARQRILSSSISSSSAPYNQFPFTPSLSSYANLSFETGDALNLNYHHEFDLITSFACLHWIKDHLAVLKGIERSLKPGGRMIIQCSGRSDGAEGNIFDLTRAVIRSEMWSRYFRGYSNPHGIYGPEEYHAWLDQAGLEELKADLTIKDLVLPGRAGLEGFIRTTWLSVTERIPEEMRPQFIREISDRYLERHPLKDGLAYVGMGMLEVAARRPTRRPE